MTSNPVQARKDLCSLLGYAEEILKAGERIVSDLTKDAVVKFHEHDVIGLEGVSIPSADGYGRWLRVARLLETLPPEPSPEYLPWLAKPTRGDGPLEPPKLVRSLLVDATVEEASDLVEAGLANSSWTDWSRPWAPRQSRITALCAATPAPSRDRNAT